MRINSKNFINWLRLALEILDIEKEYRDKIDKYIRRTDWIRRQKELDDIFGGEEWLI